MERRYPMLRIRRFFSKLDWIKKKYINQNDFEFLTLWLPFQLHLPTGHHYTQHNDTQNDMTAFKITGLIVTVRIDDSQHKNKE
jgi:hypothetical protein